MSQSVLLKNFLGMQTNTRTPNKSASQICNNFDLRSIQGDLTLRNGTIANFTSNNLISGTILPGTFDLGLSNIYIPDIGGGSEVWCVFQVAILKGQTGIRNATPSDINVLLSWIRPYWSGSAWVDEWALLNEMRLTTIRGINQYSINLDYNETIPIPSYTGTANQSSMVGWTITNVTKGESAGIVYATSDGTNVIANTTKNNNNWAIGDTVLLSQNYIPYSFLTNMGSGLSNTDIAFHKVLSDLRVGFGGQVNRLGLSIGYRQKYFNLTSFDFGSYTSTQIQNYANINGIVLDPYYCYQNSGDFALDLTSTPDPNTLPIGKYFFRMTAMLDDYEEFLVSDQNIDLTAAATIYCAPKIRMGTENKRITKIRIYCSVGVTTDLVATQPYFLVEEISVSQITAPTSGWKINPDGYLTRSSVTSELFTQLNAANISTDTNDIVGFEAQTYDGPQVISSVNSTSLTNHPSTYSIATTLSATVLSLDGFITYQDLVNSYVAGKKYTLSFYIAASIASTVYVNANSNTIGTINITTINSFTKYTFDFIPTTNTIINFSFTFGLPISGSITVYVDNVSIQANVSATYDSTMIPGVTEMTGLMGYTPTYDHVLSWDQAIEADGKTFLVNPYIDKRYVNMIFFSPISGDGAFEYDVITAENYYDAQNFSGSDLVGIALLPNGNILALMSNFCKIIDTTTGAATILDALKGCVSKGSIVSFGNKIIWCGNSDIYETNGIEVIPITSDDIRDQYQALAYKYNIMAIQEEVDSAYRFWNGNYSGSVEFTLTKKGWITSTASSYFGLTNYACGRDGIIRALNLSEIFKDATPLAGQAFHWKSTKLDLELLGIKTNSRLLIKNISLEQSVINSSTTVITLNIYYDGTLYQTITVDPTKTNPFYNVKPGMSAKIIELEIQGTAGTDTLQGAYPMVIISAINFELVDLPVGRFG